MRAMPDMTVLAPADAVRADRDDGLGAGLRRTGLPADRPRRRPGRLRCRLHVHPGSGSTGFAKEPTSRWCRPARRSPGCWRPPTCWPSTASPRRSCTSRASSRSTRTALRDGVAGHDLVVTVEEHSVFGGLGGLVAEILTASRPAPRIERIGIDDTWGESAGNDFMLNKHGLSPELISQRVLSVLGARVPS